MKKTNLWVFILFGMLVVAAMSMTGSKPNGNVVPYSDFMSQVADGKFDRVFLPSSPDEHIVGINKEGKKVEAFAPLQDVWMVSDLLKSGVTIERDPPPRNIAFELLERWFPFLVLIGLTYFMMRKGGGILSGSNKMFTPATDTEKYFFSDVAGCDEAKQEVQESVDYLKNPKEFTRLGAEIPKGLLMTGDPGNGKTLLAKAMAGEAGVPFFKVAGSDFVEIFAGMGARKVREMFAKARQASPCILFIDEIDAVGKVRSMNLGGNDEREQTLNQILVEMDGFDGSEGVLVVAATNRPDILDPALTRPGRFSRHVHVGRPDMNGRIQVLEVHKRRAEERNAKFSNDVDLAVVARGSPGFSGADLANLVNEALMFATRAKKNQVEMIDFEKAKDKLLMGLQRTSVIMDEEEKRATAYHEAGHTVVSVILGYDKLHKVTIVPHGQALGLTVRLPEKDRYSYNRKRILSDIAILMGGRAAEEVFLEDIGTGASNDMERATLLANKMVTEWGMSDRIGPMVFKDDDHSVSDDKRAEIDREVRYILDEEYIRAKKTIEENRAFIENLVQGLMQKETLNYDEIMALCPVQSFTQEMI